MPETSSLTTKQVARLCRVSDATVKRWEDAGLLKSERTGGGHRRFRAEEVARFQRQQNIGLKQKHGEHSARIALRQRPRRGSQKTYSDASPLFRCMLAGREDEAAEILISSFLHGAPLAKIFDDLVCPAMRRTGALWFDGELNVAQEHLATRAIYNAIYKLRETIPVREENEGLAAAGGGNLAFCCTIEGDFHELPSHFAQLTLESDGWEVMNFGANMPFYSFADEVLYYTPEVICISGTVITDYERIARDYKEFRARIAKLKIPVILGGRVFEETRGKQRFPAELYADSFTEVSEFAKNLFA